MISLEGGMPARHFRSLSWYSRCEECSLVPEYRTNHLFLMCFSLRR